LGGASEPALLFATSSFSFENMMIIMPVKPPAVLADHLRAR